MWQIGERGGETEERRGATLRAAHPRVARATGGCFAGASWMARRWLTGALRVRKWRAPLAGALLSVVFDPIVLHLQAK